MLVFRINRSNLLNKLLGVDSNQYKPLRLTATERQGFVQHSHHRHHFMKAPQFSPLSIDMLPRVLAMLH